MTEMKIFCEVLSMVSGLAALAGTAALLFWRLRK